MLKHFCCALMLLALGGMNAGHARASGVSQFESGLTFQQGKIALPGGMATLDLPASFRYLSPADTERVLVQGWGNMPGAKTLGMIVPADVSVLSKDGFGVIVTYERNGHVLDDDADKIDYTDMLKDLQEATLDANAARKQAGYSAMTLVGWAETPRYDKASHKLYWAKELRSEGETVSSLNYNIRVLGREGVLVLNAVASMDQIVQIRNEMRKVTGFSEFTAGNRYTDFNRASDKTAEYGIAALVAGGVATKLGLFGKLLALLLAFKKIILIAVAAVGFGLFNFFRARKKVDLDKH